jgi:hypothetical protein
VLLLPVPLNFLVKAMLALIASAGFSYFLLAKWRNEMAEQLGSAQQRRQAEKSRLRAALAGDETAATAGDRVAEPSAGGATGPDDEAAGAAPVGRAEDAEAANKDAEAR